MTRMCGDGRELYQRKTIKILQWMLVARRPLKRFEIESGISFDEKNPQINEKNRIRGNVLGLCSPILDVTEDPGATVKFVHFTAKE